MPFPILATLTALLAAGVAAQSSREYRAITLTGCVQATGDPERFLLTVPADYPDAVRGVAKGDPVPDGSGPGPAPRPNPQSAQPRDVREPGLPEGRYSTPTVQNHSYQLLNVKAARLKPLVGKAIEVRGEIPVEGYPTGDAPTSAGGARALSVLNPPLRAKHLKVVAASCAALIRAK